MTLTLLESRTNAVPTENPLPSLAHPRNDNEEPSVTVEKAEMPPKRPKERTLRLDPSERLSSIEHCAPTAALPKIDKELPNVAARRIDKLLPSERKSQTLAELPNRLMERTERVLPSSTF
jgi:hypothetical protein